MPTLLRVDGFQFFFFANDHPPPHVHVKKADDYAKIDFLTGIVLYQDMKPADLKHARELSIIHKDDLRRAWDEWFKDR